MGLWKKTLLNKPRTRKLKADKANRFESNPSFFLKLEDLKEQVKFLQNEKLLLKEQLDDFRNNKIHLFKKG